MVQPVRPNGPSRVLKLWQPHKWERCHTLTQNLEGIGLWVLSIIECSTFTFPSNVGHNYSHLHTTLPFKCEPINSSSAPSSGSFYLIVSRLLLSLQQNRHKELVPQLLLSSQWNRLPRSYHSSNGVLIQLLGQEGSPGGSPTLRPEQPHKWERRQINGYDNGRILWNKILNIT